MKKIFTLIMLAATVVVVYGQSPQKMSYQCVVRNTAGALVTSHAVGLKISILQGSSTGAVVFSETYSPVPQTNVNGLLTVEIGSGTASVGSLSTIDWSAGPYFLKTETDPDGSTNYTITGTSQLLSVPYALYAKTAANGFSGNYNDLTNKPLLFSGSYNDLTSKPILFSGSYNDLTNKPTLFDGTWNSLTGKPAGFADGIDNVDDADNSITNEIQTLNLSGTTLSLSNGGGSVTLPSSGGGDNWGTQVVVTDATLTGNGTTATPLKIAQQSASSGQVLKWSGTSWAPGSDLAGTSFWAQNGTKIYYNTDDVGIGISNPVAFLHVFGNCDVNHPLLLLTENQDDYARMMFKSTAFPTKNWTIAAAFWPYDGYSTMNFYYDDGTTGKDLVSIAGNGNVGIGTVEPSAKLEVTGQVKITGGAPGAGKVLTSDANGLASWQTLGQSPWLSNGSNIYYNTGYVGIGTNTPSAGLHIKATTWPGSFIYLESNSGEDAGMRFNEGTEVKWHIYNDASAGGLIIQNYGLNISLFCQQTSGNVGIGTNAPGYKLQVGNAGDGTQARANAWNLLSDARLKKDLVRLNDPIRIINSLNGYYFYWNTGIDQTRQIGFSAQEVREFLPEIVSEGEDGYLSVEYGKMTPLLLEAIKEQQKQIDELKQLVYQLMQK